MHVRGVGPIEAGMSIKEAERAGGVRIEVTEFDTFGGRCYYATAVGFPDLDFLVQAPGDRAPTDPKDGLIASVTAANAGWRTPSGAHIGMSDAEIRRLYPDRLRRDGHQYREEGFHLTFEPVTAQDRPFGLRFEFGDGKVVDLIHSGDADVITYPEGCA